VASGAGAILGLGFGHLAASRRAVRPGLSWFRLTAMAGNLWIAGALALLVGIAAAVGLTPVALIGAVLAVPLVLVFVVAPVKLFLAWLVHLGQRAATHPDPFPAQQSLPLVAALGLPVLLPLAVGTAGVALDLGDVWVYWPVAAGILSLLTMVFVRTALTFDAAWDEHGDSPARAPAGPAPPRSERARTPLTWTVSRATLYTAFLVALVAFPLSTGLDTVPVPLLRQGRSAPDTLSGTLGWVRPDADFFRVDLGERRFAVLNAAVDPYANTWLRLDGMRLQVNELMAVSGGRHWLAVESDDDVGGSGSVEYQATLDPRPVLVDSAEVPAPEGWHFMEMVLAETDVAATDSVGRCRQDSTWVVYRGRVGGRVQDANIRSHIELMPFFENHLPAAGAGVEGVLCAFDHTRPGEQVGDDVAVRFTPGPQRVDTMGSTLAIQVGANGAWAADVLVSLPPTLRRGAPGLRDYPPVPLLMALKVERFEEVDPARLLEDARRLGPDQACGFAPI